MEGPHWSSVLAEKATDTHVLPLPIVPVSIMLQQRNDVVRQDIRVGIAAASSAEL